MNFQSLPWHKYFLEFLGTFFLTFTLGLALGGGSQIMAGVAGATLATLVYLGRSVSGAHYNPAISLAMMIHGHLSPKDTGFYALAQIAGAFAGAAMVPALVQDGSFTFMLVPAGSANLFQVLLAELLFSFLLALVYLHALLGSANQLYSFYGLAIGLTYGVAWLAIREISGAVLNPALGLGVDTLAGAYEAMWPYLVAPLVGTSLAAFTFRFTSPKDKPIPLKTYFPDKVEAPSQDEIKGDKSGQEADSALETKSE